MRRPTETRDLPVTLTVSSPTEPAEPVEVTGPVVPWLLAALVWSAGAVLVGWLLVGVLVAAAWLTAVRTPVTSVLATIAQGWLSAHGVAAQFGHVTLAVTPLTLTALIGLACAAAAHHASGQVVTEPDASPRERWRAWAGLVGACAATYTALVGLLGLLVGTQGQAGAALPGALAVSGVGAGLGALAGLRLDPLAGLPGWVRRLPAAVGVGVGTLAAGSAVALVAALVLNAGRVGALQESLAPDVVGVVLLVLVQCAFAPNLVAWTGAYALGAGVALGEGSLVTPAATQVGLLPAMPVFAAVPTAAGAVASVWLLRGLRAAGERPRVVRWSWQGALAGAGTALGWAALSWLSRGDLGVGRLTGMGPRFPDLLWWCGGLVLAGAVAASLATWAWALRSDGPIGRVTSGPDASADEPTAVVTAGPGAPEDEPTGVVGGGSGP